MHILYQPLFPGITGLTSGLAAVGEPSGEAVTAFCVAKILYTCFGRTPLSSRFTATCRMLPASLGTSTHSGYRRSADFLAGQQLVAQHLLADQVEDHFFGGSTVDGGIDLHRQRGEGMPDVVAMDDLRCVLPALPCAGRSSRGAAGGRSASRPGKRDRGRRAGKRWRPGTRARSRRR